MVVKRRQAEPWGTCMCWYVCPRVLSPGRGVERRPLLQQSWRSASHEFRALARWGICTRRGHGGGARLEPALWRWWRRGVLLHQANKLPQLTVVQICDGPIGHASSRPVPQRVTLVQVYGLPSHLAWRWPDKQINDVLSAAVHQCRDRSVV